ncbi:hypothetical protein TorRG33x02_163910 [Trema orientale]|uniref:Uncharacterized protein n=1 Tax=Trema orientale TaxID=63057 RepID=A0A2P5EQP0_TREOI|nr:hypothetical protein TorRG33x02_163910 [Trema orientale]
MSHVERRRCEERAVNRGQIRCFRRQMPSFFPIAGKIFFP